MYNAASHTKLDDKALVEKYKNLIQGDALRIWCSKDVKSLDFINSLNINKLEIYNSKKIVPKLKSNIIQKLEITNCDIQSVKDFQLENLEILRISNFSEQYESETLAQEILRFQKLKELVLHGWIIDTTIISQMTDITNLGLSNCGLLSTEALRPLINLEQLYLQENKELDITSLQYMIKLTKLNLSDCGLLSVDAIRSLFNLQELNLHQNKDINITSLQYLTKLTKLNLVSCNLVSLDALRPLTLLKELVISWNSIVYLQAIIKLNQLSKLDARNNKIVDFQDFQHHPKVEMFDVKNQSKPTKEELQIANILREINSPITCLKQINMKLSHIKHQNIIIRTKKQLKVSLNSHAQFLARIALLIQNNAFDGYQ
ncbi:Conserved_hypothetical protein [Hexamita inflata]|uniref:Uncharacterized protein n=1 Tax=Hexamita inflata TaxID=28002 RepID=A0AA86P5A4_9EUKA|nr:Conserved hypothetical protein [Hexamita inflata]